MSRYFFELSGESKDMPPAEAEGCISAEAGDYSVVSQGPGYLIADFDERFLDGIAERVALTKSVGRYLGEYDPDDVSNLESADLPEGTFAVRGKRFEGMMKDADSQGMIRRIGGVLSARRDVDLREPDFTIKMLMSDKVHLFIEEHVTETDLLEKRKVGERPFFSPISLHPKYARALINLTGVKRGGTVLDPFCGTGGIVIEAADMGMKAIASDFDPEMVAGCRENLEYYGLPIHDFDVLDIGEIADRFPNLDAVCTDPPYGRSTKTGGEDIDRIYRRAGTAIASALKPGSMAGIVLPHIVQYPEMKLETVFEQRVHGSLTRHYHLFRKPIARDSRL